MSRTGLIWASQFLLAACFAAANPSAMIAAEQHPALAIGSPAPDFSLPGVDGKTYKLADFADAKLLAIVFTCDHCPTAQAYEGRIKQLAADFKDRGVTVVAVSPNDPEAVRLDELGYTDLTDSLDDMKIRAKDHHFNFPYLYDGEHQSLAKACGPAATPHVFLFDVDRKLRFSGRIDNNENPAKATTHETRDAIEALLAGRPVPVETTKTIGCSIKWTEKQSSARAAVDHWDKEPVDLKTIDEAGVRDLVANKTSGKLRLINVWSTSCGPCVIEFPELVTMHRMYRNRDFELVTITTDSPDNPEAPTKFLQKQHASTTNFIFAEDDPYKLADALSADWQGALPYTMLVRPGGEVVYKHMGPIDPLELRRAIVEQLSRYYFKAPTRALAGLQEVSTEAAGDSADAKPADAAVAVSVPAPDADGFISLFDGQSLEGWTPSETKTSVKVEDGVMVVGGGGRSHIFYSGPVHDHDFKNFELKAEVKTELHANSGIYFHTEYQETDFPAKGYEAQVNNSHSDWRRTGSLYAVEDVRETPVKDGEWFEYDIRVEGKRIVLKLNDKTVVDYTEPADPPKVEGHPGRQISHGTFALQAHDPGSVVRYRNIRVKPLP